MAESAVTTTGIDELRRAINEFPASVTAVCRRVAEATANGILVDARRRLQSQTHGTGATAAAIYIEEDAANHQFIIASPGVPHPRFSLHRMKRSGRTHTQRVSQNNLPLWLEYGTQKMPARPYMRPAAEAAKPRYEADMQTAVETEMRRSFGG